MHLVTTWQATLDVIGIKTPRARCGQLLLTPNAGAKMCPACLDTLSSQQVRKLWHRLSPTLPVVARGGYYPTSGTHHHSWLATFARYLVNGFAWRTGARLADYLAAYSIGIALVALLILAVLAVRHSRRLVRGGRH